MVDVEVEVVVFLLAICHFRVFPTLVHEYDTPLTTRVAPVFVHFVPCTWGEFAAATGIATTMTATIATTKADARPTLNT